MTRGAGEGVVVATGLNTELGKVSSLVEESEDEQTPLEERLDSLGYRLIFVTLFIALFVAVSGIWAGKDLFLMIETGIALAVAAIPEGLPIVATIALAKGLQVMAAKNVLINRLSSVETLGSTGIICTDKTGTLTENKMSVSLIVLPGSQIEVNGENGDVPNKKLDPDGNSDLRMLLETGMLCNNASLNHSEKNGAGSGDPLEVALLSLGRMAGYESSDLMQQYPEEKEEAFDAEVKMMATWNRMEGQQYRVHVKGAPGAVLEASDSIREDGQVQPLTPEKKREWQKINQELAKDGLRMLAFAYKMTDSTVKEPYNSLVFLGLVALLDPAREDVKPAIALCKKAGIRVVMVTGDQVETARYIARAVGLPDDEEAMVIHGNELPSKEELENSNMDKKLIVQCSIFARISPKQKLNLIEFYQDSGQIVAMTGDGVNDAPALKKADIGIAMGQRGTQVAREASDMVLTDDAFSSIVAAIEQGRVIFGNIRRFIYYLMSCNVSEVMVVGMASLIGSPLPILPLQILFLNLVTDVFPALALGVGEGEEGAMRRAAERS
ncbi:MAG: HAD-IC family P-type ATPase [Balneolaceae bacterium]|nr:HAD-IC family P-type ATPase [Balneolaceae bacterium]